MTTNAERDHAGEHAAKVFISYSRKDLAFADRLEAALTARGFEPLIDRTEIYAFEDWWTRIETLIESADTVVFALSPDSVSSAVALKEGGVRGLPQQALRPDRLPPGRRRSGAGGARQAELRLVR